MTNNIKKVRTQKGVSQYYVAKRLGMAASNYSAIESGTVEDPRMSTVLKIAFILEVSPGELYSLETKERNQLK